MEGTRERDWDEVVGWDMVAGAPATLLAVCRLKGFILAALPFSIGQIFHKQNGFKESTKTGKAPHRGTRHKHSELPPQEESLTGRIRRDMRPSPHLCRFRRAWGAQRH